VGQRQDVPGVQEKHTGAHHPAVLERANAHFMQSARTGAGMLRRRVIYSFMGSLVANPVLDK
jgi:hypothetical protein